MQIPFDGRRSRPVAEVFPRLKKTADGYICAYCHKLIEIAGRRRWCSYECRAAAFALTNAEEWSQAVKKRAGGRCERCGRDASGGYKPSDGEAHHIVPLAEGGMLCGPEGGKWLCRECHAAVHNELNQAKKPNAVSTQKGLFTAQYNTRTG